MGGRALAALVILAMSLGVLTACSTTHRDLVAVPADAATVAEAMDLVAPGGLVLLAPGTYAETIVVDVEGVTLRGEDRNAVVIDGQGLRPEGVVVVADGVRVENLTVRNHTFNGVLVTGLHDADGARAHGIDGYDTLDPEAFPPIQRFAIDRVTASNNGLYGIYAFDAQHGTITNSFASGSADSGFYVGQCADCDILVAGNTAEDNAVGFEAANASDSLVIAGNAWVGNRIGMTLLSNYQEAFVPQRGVTVVGNLIADNVSAESPSQAEGGFGTGIGIQGSIDNVIDGNRIEGNTRAGIIVANAEDLPATGTRITGTVFAGNGVDVANLSQKRTPAVGNCVVGEATALPAGFATADCDGEQAAAMAAELPVVEVPRGMSFLDVPLPADQPGLTGDLRAIPGALPAALAPFDRTAYGVPASGWRPAP